MIFKRPWLVLLLLVISLIFTASAVMRVWNGVQYWGFLDDLPMSVSPLYLVVTGSVWGIFGILAAIWVWWGQSRASQLVTTGALVYSLQFWLEQLFVMTNPLRRVNWPFLAVLTVVSLLIVFLSFRHSQVRKFYGGRHEQEIQ